MYDMPELEEIYNGNNVRTSYSIAHGDLEDMV